METMVDWTTTTLYIIELKDMPNHHEFFKITKYIFAHRKEGN